MEQDSGDGSIVEPELLGIIGADFDGLAAGGIVNAIPLDGFHLRYDDRSGDAAENDLAVFIGPIQALAGKCAIVHEAAVGIGDLEQHTLQGCFLIRTGQLIDDERTLRLIAELQRHRLASLDGCGLRCIVQKIAVPCAGFLHHQRRAGIDAADGKAACAVCHIFAVGIAHHRSVCGRHHKFHIRKGLMGCAVDLLHQQVPLGRISKIELHHILLLAADVGGLGCGVNDMAAVTGKLLHNIGAFFQTRHGEAAVGGSLVGADDRATRPAGAAEVLHLEHGVAHRFAGDRIILPHHQRRQGDIFKGQYFGSAGLDIDLLRGLLDGVPRGRLLLRYLVPAVPQTGQLELAVFIGIESAKVIDLAAAGIVAGVGNVELCTLQGIAGHTVHLFNGQCGLLMVFKINGVVSIGIERRKLRGRIQQIGGRHGFLDNFVHTGEQVLQLRLALAVCLDLIDAVAVCGADFKHGVRNRLAGVGVVLVDGQVGAFLILNGQGAGSACEQLHVVLPQVEDV